MWSMKTWVLLSLCAFVYGSDDLVNNLTRFVKIIFYDPKYTFELLDDKFVLEGCIQNYTRVDVAWAIRLEQLTSNITLEVLSATEKVETTDFLLHVTKNMKEEWFINMTMNNSNLKIMKGKMIECEKQNAGR